jgi:hypothetical protein
MKTLHALAAVLVLSGSALGGTITGTSTSFNPEIRQRVNAVDDYAIWNAASLTANETARPANAGWIGYTLTASSPATPVSNNVAAAIFYTGSQYLTGGLSYSTSNLDGKGFTLTVPQEYANGRQLDVWILANGPVGVLVEATSGGDTSSPIALAPYSQYIVSFASTGLSAPLTVNMSNVGNFSSAQGGMSVGAAALTPLAVPEPEYWMAGLMLLAGAGLYFVVVYGAVLFGGKSDGEKRP